jgi:hypothetical protein
VVAAELSRQLLVDYQWCAVTVDVLALQLPQPVAQAAWRLLLLAAGRTDNMGLMAGVCRAVQFQRSYQHMRSV